MFIDLAMKTRSALQRSAMFGTDGFAKTINVSLLRSEDDFLALERSINISSLRDEESLSI